LGGGYVWEFYRNFYLNSWLATHVVIAGDDEVAVGKRTYELKLFTPEISLKLGWHF